MLFHSKFKVRVLFSIPVVLSLGIIGSMYWCFLTGFVLLVPLTAWLALFYLFVHVWIVLMLACLAMTCVTDPGGIPPSYNLLEEESYTHLEEQFLHPDLVQLQATFCDKCNSKRPARAHHCSLCERCILRMDHHCPWIGNCVGFYNHRYFTQFLGYTTSCCIAVAFSCGWMWSQAAVVQWSTLIGAVVACVLSVSIGGLFCFHLWLIMTNRSTLELGPIDTFNVFDLGSCKKNTEVYCGTRWLYYLVPVPVALPVSGVHFPARLRHVSGGVYSVNQLV